MTTTQHSTRLRRRQVAWRLLDRLDALASAPTLGWLWRLFWCVFFGCGFVAAWDLRFVTWGLLALIVVSVLILAATIEHVVKGLAE